MSTLVTHHDGLDRVLRGWEFVQGKRHGRTGVKVSDRTHGATSESAAPTGQDSIATASRPSFFARLAAAWKQRSENARFEELMQQDPRVFNDYLAAKARAEWQD